MNSVTTVYAALLKVRLNVLAWQYFALRPTFTLLIDDTNAKTLAAASSAEVKDKAAKSDLSTKVGSMIAEKGIAKGVKAVVFDRGGYRYHGRVKALAEAARAAGLEF